MQTIEIEFGGSKMVISFEPSVNVTVNISNGSTLDSSEKKQIREDLKKAVPSGDVFFTNTYLKKSRLSTTLSQREAAELIGIAQSYYCDMEKGRRNITRKTVAKLKTIPEFKNFYS